MVSWNQGRVGIKGTIVPLLSSAPVCSFQGARSCMCLAKLHDETPCSLCWIQTRGAHVHVSQFTHGNCWLVNPNLLLKCQQEQRRLAVHQCFIPHFLVSNSTPSTIFAASGALSCSAGCLIWDCQSVPQTTEKLPESSSQTLSV